MQQNAYGSWIGQLVGHLASRLRNTYVIGRPAVMFGTLLVVTGPSNGISALKTSMREGAHQLSSLRTGPVAGRPICARQADGDLLLAPLSNGSAPVIGDIQARDLALVRVHRLGVELVLPESDGHNWPSDLVPAVDDADGDDEPSIDPLRRGLSHRWTIDGDMTPSESPVGCRRPGTMTALRGHSQRTPRSIVHEPQLRPPIA